MKFQVAKPMLAATMLASVAIALATASFADGRRPHDRHVAQVATYRPIEGFSRVVADKRFTGFFTAVRGGCSVSLIVSQDGDEVLRTPVQRIQFELGATQVADVAANDRMALGIACSVDGNSMNLASLTRTRTRTVARD